LPSSVVVMTWSTSRAWPVVSNQGLSASPCLRTQGMMEQDTMSAGDTPASCEK
jgi:hypothetical protein